MVDRQTYLKGTNEERLHTCAFYLLCGFGLFSSISIGAGNVFLGMLTIVFLCRLLLKHDDWKDVLPSGRVRTAFLALMGAVLLSAAFSTDVVLSLRRFVEYYGYRMIGLYAVLLMVREKRRLLWIGICIAVSFIINDCAIVFQGIQGNFRAGGFAFSMVAGATLSMFIPVLLIFLHEKYSDRRWRAAVSAVLILSGAALLYNGTRGAWVAVPLVSLACAAFIVRRKKKLLAGAVLVLAVFSAAFALSPTLSARLVSITDINVQTNWERILLWKSACHMFQDHPMFGVGFGCFERQYQATYILPGAKEPQLFHAHSNVMNTLAECGAIGLGALLFFWCVLITYGFRTWLATHNIAALILSAVLLGLILQGLTNYNMGTSMVMKLHWLLLGLCFSWLRADDVRSFD